MAFYTSTASHSGLGRCHHVYSLQCDPSIVPNWGARVERWLWQEFFMFEFICLFAIWWTEPKASGIVGRHCASDPRLALFPLLIVLLLYVYFVRLLWMHVYMFLFVCAQVHMEPEHLIFCVFFNCRLCCLVFLSSWHKFRVILEDCTSVGKMPHQISLWASLQCIFLIRDWAKRGKIFGVVVTLFGSWA